MTETAQIIQDHEKARLFDVMERKRLMINIREDGTVIIFQQTGKPITAASLVEAIRMVGQ